MIHLLVIVQSPCASLITNLIYYIVNIWTGWLSSIIGLNFRNEYGRYQETEKMVRKLLLFLSFSLLASSYSSSIPESFIHCLSLDEFTSNVPVLSALYVPSNSSLSINLGLPDWKSEVDHPETETSTLAIITPERYSHVQTSSHKYNFEY